MLRRLLRGRFARRLAMLSGGTLAGQALLVLSSPLLTRLYTPAEFGALAVVSALGSILGGITALRYEYAVPVVREDGEAAAVTVLGLGVTLVVTLLAALAVALGGPAFAALVGLPGLAGPLWLLPPLLLFWGIALALGGWSIRRGTFRANALGNFLQYAGQAGTQVVLGLAGGGVGSLVGGYALGQVGRGLAFVATLGAADRALLRAVRAPGLAAAARAHWRYPAFSGTSSLLQSASQMLPAVLVALLYGPVTAGLFGLGQRIMGLPVRLLGETASAVFLGEVAQTRGRALTRLVARTAAGFLVMGILGLAPILLAGPALFALVFGEPWREAGRITQVLVPLYLARFVTVPVSQTLNVFGRQHLHFTAALLNVAALGLGFGLGAWLGLGPLTTLLVYSLASTAAFLFYFAAVWRTARRAGAAPPAGTGAGEVGEG